MRYICKASAIIVLFGLIGCEKQNSENIDVDTFVDLLVSGQYESNELPAFSKSDIPALLSYRNETTIITNFPRNFLSSYFQPKCRLGMYVLWAIESVRAIEIDSEYLIGRFPSLNPVLALNDASPLELVSDDQSHIDAADAYYEWWNSSYLFGDRMEIDPLEDTEYRWH